MTTPTLTRPAPDRPLTRWLLQNDSRDTEGPYEGEAQAHHDHPWWRVMCLTGVDYFSTLGYQPGIAALAAGVLSPIATLILVVLTLVGALPIYRRVAAESPHGEGSIAMLEHLLPWWQGKLFVLCLLGFAATDFIITITLSAADGAAHLLENPLAPAALHGHPVAITLVLVGILGAVFLKGFGEAIGIAVGLVAVYLALNLVVLVVAFAHVFTHPAVVSDWRHALVAAHSSPLAMIGVSLLVFPKLALGLSGFETGVAVMPLVHGKQGDTYAQPTGRIANTRNLLLTAAVMMSVFLVTSSFATITLIPEREFQAGGRANGRALAFLAHQYLGSGFGTVYDISTICILWFAGASAMAGLLNLVPRYLPRYGMAPEWTRAARPLVLVFIALAFAITIIFRADVNAQGGAYATGVLVLMSSAAVAVTISTRRRGKPRAAVAFGIIALVFAYTTIANVFERPDGVKIAAIFIGAIVVTSLASRVWRVTELRVTEIVIDPVAQSFIDAIGQDHARLIAHEPNGHDAQAYHRKEKQQRAIHSIPPDDAVYFLEVTVRDPSEFAPTLRVTGERFDGYCILHLESAAVANALAALLLDIRDRTGSVPHAYFNWGESAPLVALLRYVLFGQGDTAPLTHEVLRRAEHDPHRRPIVHVG